MNYREFLIKICSTLVSCILVSGVELTFELPNNEKQCFYEEIPLNVTIILGFQVVTGGQYDVDVILKAPHSEIIYQQIKGQFDSHTFQTKIPGVYSVCFSNEFSTFSHKTVYMNFHVEKEKALFQTGEHLIIMTQLETSVHEIHRRLTTAKEYQTYHRLNEAKGRKRAEELNEQVLWWSVLEIIAILISAIGQVFIVIRNFSQEKKINQLNI